MKKVRSTAPAGLQLLKGGVSLLALTALAATAAPAMAQDSGAKKSDEVVVVGVRKSLKTAQQIKKDADTVVDSITASDIGSFPDKSVAEALQRVAGITVNRFAATGDTAHFSAEPSGVVVRGLQQVRSEFNGRDIFTADSNRGLSWSDVSPELMGGVDTYKNQTAELIEGGIAGTINLRTRLPFDTKGRLLAATGEYTWGDLSKKGQPAVSGIFSDRFQTSLGEFGVMINGAHSAVTTNSQGIQFGRMAIVNTSYWGGQRYIPMSVAFRDNTYDRTRDGISVAGQWQNNEHTMLLTLQYNQSKKVEQWEEFVSSASSGADAWATGIDAISTNSKVECLGGKSNCTFDANGYIQTGTLVQNSSQWYGAVDAPTGAAASNGQLVCYSWSGGACGATAQRGTGWANDTRWSDSLNNTKDVSLNFKWDVTSRLKTNFDVQYVDAIQKNYDISTELATYANTTWNTTGDHPTVVVDDGTSYYAALAAYNAGVANHSIDPNTTPAPTRTTGFNLTKGGLTDPANYRQHFIMDHVTDSDGHEFATRADLAYSFDSPWLNTLKAGVRYADREQTVRWSTYNWANVVNTWSNYDANNYYITGNTYPNHNDYGVFDFKSDFYGGGALNANQGVFFNVDALKDREGFAAAYNQVAYQPRYTDGTLSNTWVPVCYRTGEIGSSTAGADINTYNGKMTAYYASVKAHNDDVAFNADPANAGNQRQVTAILPLPAKPTLTPNTGEGCFKPSEIADVSEKTKAFYVQLKFGGNDATIFNGITVVGNVGVRYVETQNISTGGVNYTDNTVYPTSPTSLQPVDPSNPTGPQVLVVNPAYYIAQDDRDFMKSSNVLTTYNVTHRNWLPSFNVRLGLTDKWFLRFAASKAMSRPDIGNLKAYSSVSRSQVDPNPNVTIACDPQAFVCDSSGHIVKLRVAYTASANNPNLKPVTADQVDMSVENYFTSTGSFTFNLFYKKFHDYIQMGRYDQAFTNNGVTKTVTVSGPVNGDGATIKGFEVAYQTFFDSLPAPWNGLGVQANFTHLHNTGIKSSNVVVNSGDGSSGQLGGGATGNSSTVFTDLPLEGLSDNTYNIVGMYEKGAWSARLAYNWRSQYLVTSQDCCMIFPIWQKAAGYLDGRVAYRINDHIEMSVEGSNLLNTETVLLQQVDGNRNDGHMHDRVLLPGSWFKNDRRLQASIRLKY